MLSRLSVRSLALVSSVSVEFSPGFNAITGETGAGKSVLMGALGLLLGARADASAVRHGAPQAEIAAVFSLSGRAHDAVAALLDEAGLPAMEDGELFVRRTVKAAGGGSVSVNDSPASAAFLRRLGAVLIDLHGPHDHQSLLSPAAQLALLDAYAGEPVARARVAYDAAYAAWRDAAARLADLSGEIEDLPGQLDLLRYRVKEIEEAALEEGEEEQLRQEQKIAGAAARILELAQSATWALSEGESNALSSLQPARKACEELAGLLPEAAEWGARAARLGEEIVSLSGEIARAADRIEADPARLAWLEERLALYADLRRKYGGETRDVIAAGEKARARLEALENREERRRAAEKDVRAARAEAEKAAAALAKARRAAAEPLANDVMRATKELGFADGRFRVALSETAEPGPTGRDAAEFLFSANVGEGERPLKDIASSGEISRVALGLKAVLAAVDEIPILVFDEIDANVGGETAKAVGKKLAEVARARQVIAITHLAPVAARAESHYAVGKRVEDGRTVTRIAKVEGDARVEEMTRILGGETADGEARKLAEALLRGASAE